MSNAKKFRSIIPILKRHDAQFAGVFGSYARGEEKETSDIDLLVEFSSTKSLIELVGIEQELKSLKSR
ncbi:nucleotidyltransferase domain-containing protein [Candidatus Uhrbacteria bacterium]|nr:nucleotidyltransferase domain-containing protein [Candidatus Uhrbacteria bacterium]